MGKKYTTFLTLFTVICITLTGCERENEQTANQGRLNRVSGFSWLVSFLLSV